MRSIEEKIDIPENRKDDFRREIMNYIGALAVEGKKFEWHTNDRLRRALELKLFEDQKDSIKLKTLVSSGRRQGHAGEDRHHQEPAHQVLRLQRGLARRTCSTTWPASSRAATPRTSGRGAAAPPLE